jgi:hypothetical protein
MIDLIDEVLERAELIHCLLGTSVYPQLSPRSLLGAFFSFFPFVFEHHKELKNLQPSAP